MNLSKLYKQGKLPRTKATIEKIADSAKSQWESMVAEGTPQWWAKMALSSGPGGGGGILVKNIPGGREIYYADKGKYDYMSILDKGRSRFDMKPGLLGSSRARKGKNGTYLIIAFTKNQDNSKVSPKNNTINAAMKKTGSIMGKNAKGEDVRRNKYNYRKLADKQDKKNGAYVVEQKVKGGGIQRSYMKFVCLSESSTGWYYPQIPAHRFMDKLKKDVKSAMESKVMKQAITQDYQDLVQELIKKANLKK